MKNILIGILIVVILVLGFLLLRPKPTRVVIDTSSDVPMSNAGGGNNNPTTTPTDPNKISKWGISFMKPSNWDITTNDDFMVVLTQKSGEGAGDTMTIQYAVGETIADTDAKFGNIILFYSDSSNQWFRTNDENGTETEIAKPVMTVGNLTVFGGVRRWKTYIVPLSHKTFIKANITGSGYAQPLDDLVKTLQVI